MGQDKWLTPQWLSWLLGKSRTGSHCARVCVYCVCVCVCVCSMCQCSIFCGVSMFCSSLLSLSQCVFLECSLISLCLFSTITSLYTALSRSTRQHTYTNSISLLHPSSTILLWLIYSLPVSSFSSVSVLLPSEFLVCVCVCVCVRVFSFQAHSHSLCIITPSSLPSPLYLFHLSSLCVVFAHSPA